MNRFVPENRPFEKWRFHLPTIDFQICSKAFAVSFREGIQQTFLGAKRLRHLKWMTDGCAAFLLGWFSGTCEPLALGRVHPTNIEHTYTAKDMRKSLPFDTRKRGHLKQKCFTCFHIVFTTQKENQQNCWGGIRCFPYLPFYLQYISYVSRKGFASWHPFPIHFGTPPFRDVSGNFHFSNQNLENTRPENHDWSTNSLRKEALWKTLMNQLVPLNKTGYETLIYEGGTLWGEGVWLISHKKSPFIFFWGLNFGNGTLQTTRTLPTHRTTRWEYLFQS